MQCLSISSDKTGSTAFRITYLYFTLWYLVFYAKDNARFLIHLSIIVKVKVNIVSVWNHVTNN